jgi:hypothetical protein
MILAETQQQLAGAQQSEICTIAAGDPRCAPLFGRGQATALGRALQTGRLAAAA